MKIVLVTFWECVYSGRNFDSRYEFTLPEGYEEYENCLGLYYLCQGEKYKDEMIKLLENFVEGYQLWILSLPEQNPDIPGELNPEKNLVLERLEAAAERMAKGIRLLKQDNKNSPIFLSDQSGHAIAICSLYP
jgi:hypothetical protein